MQQNIRYIVYFEFFSLILTSSCIILFLHIYYEGSLGYTVKKLSYKFELSFFLKKVTIPYGIKTKTSNLALYIKSYLFMLYSGRYSHLLYDANNF